MVMVTYHWTIVTNLLVMSFVTIASNFDAICYWLLSNISLNSSICLFIKAVKFVTPPLLLLVELSPWIDSCLLVTGTTAGLIFIVFLLPVFCRLAVGASADVGLLLATILPTELFNKPLLAVFLVES